MFRGIAEWRRRREEVRRRRAFERRCRDATQAVIRRGWVPDAAAVEASPEESSHWLFEYRLGIARLRSEVFYWGAFTSCVAGLYFLGNGIILGTLLMLTVAPALALYPLMRFLLGGRDSKLAALAAFALQELLKHALTRRRDR
jgi:hypothetical protein